MRPDHVHWFILGGGLSPYTLTLWEQVASRSGHQVHLAYTPRESQLEFSHEGDFIRSGQVSLVAIDSLKSVAKLARQAASAKRAIVVCMGHSPIYNIALSAILRVISPKHLVLYLSDTNGFAQVEKMAISTLHGTFANVKRSLLGTIFRNSLDLGYANALAHRLIGIPNGIKIPLLPIEFPAAMVPQLPPAIQKRVDQLPRPRLLSVARLVKNKNLVTLASAFEKAVAAGMPGSLTIIGEGPERARIEPISCRIPDRLFLTGAIPFETSRCIFGAFDAMVLPSIFEPWGIAIIEALGWGLPVLSSFQCGAGMSMAVENSTVIKLCHTSITDIQTSLTEFVDNLDFYSKAAKQFAPNIRARFGMIEVADQLITLSENFEGLRSIK